jgi:hypothetical protein
MPRSDLALTACVIASMIFSPQISGQQHDLSVPSGRSVLAIKAAGAYLAAQLGGGVRVDPDVKCATARHCAFELQHNTRAAAQLRRRQLGDTFARALHAQPATLHDALACPGAKKLCKLQGFTAYVQVREPMFRRDGAATVTMRIFENKGGSARPRVVRLVLVNGLHGWIVQQETSSDVQAF